MQAWKQGRLVMDTIPYRKSAAQVKNCKAGECFVILTAQGWERLVWCGVQLHYNMKKQGAQILAWVEMMEF